MKKVIRNLALCCIAALLSACAALQIDVDVYKGPLSDEKDVQTEQLISLAMTSQRLLMDLQRQLMKDLDSESKKKILFKPKGNSRKINHYGIDKLATADNRDVAYGWVDKKFCDKFDDNSWLLKSGVRNKEAIVARVSMACNLEELLSLFRNNDEQIRIRTFLAKSQAKIDKFSQLFEQYEKTKSESLNLNTKARQLIDEGITDTLQFLIQIQQGKLPSLNNSNITNELAEELSQLINPKMLEAAEELVNPKFKISNKTGFSSLDIQNKAQLVKHNLQTDTKFSSQLLELRNGIKEICLINITNKRLCESGYARGMSISPDDSELHNVEFGTLKLITDQIENKANNAGALNANRADLGIATLGQKVQYDRMSIDEKDSLNLYLHSMLLNYAGKLMILADKQVLLSNKSKSSRKAAKQYTQVLQSLGSAIIVQINEIKARDRHDKQQQQMNDIDVALASHFFAGNSEQFKGKVIASLSKDKSVTTEKIGLMNKAIGKLGDWQSHYKKFQNTIQNKKNLEERITSIEAALKLIVNDSLIVTDNNQQTYIDALFKHIKDQITAELCNGSNAQIDCSTGAPLQQIEKSKLRYALGLLQNTDLKNHFYVQGDDIEKENRTTQVHKQLNAHVNEAKSSLTSVKKVYETQLKIHQNNLNELLALVQSKSLAVQCIVKAKCDALTSQLATKQTEKELLDSAITFAKSKNLAADGSPTTWAPTLASHQNTSVNNLIAKKAIIAEKLFLPSGFDCKTPDNKTCDSGFALKGVVRHLESLMISLEVAGSDSERENVKNALRQAYDISARRQYLIPTSSYLRSSYPSSALQKNNSASDWQNMLQRGALRSIPFIGSGFANDDLIQQQVDKQYWQNINTVRITGGGESNYVVVKDDIGNWYVKGYSADPAEIYQSLANVSLYNAAGSAGYFLDNNQGAIGMKSSGNVLDAMYGRFYEKYTNATKSQFDTLKSWLDKEQWKPYLDTKCKNKEGQDTELKDLIGEETVEVYETSLKGQKSAYEKVAETTGDEATGKQASAINQMLSATASFANNLMKKSLSLCKQAEDETVDRVVIGKTLYDDFVAKQVTSRQSTLNKFEQNILFLREGLPENELVSPIPLEETE